MQSGNGMTMQEAEQEIKYYQKIFQVARLLKGEDVERTFYQQGKGTCENVQDGCPCYSLWKKNGKCENCSSYKALREKKQMIKLEFLESEVYQVISRYMEIDGQPYVMELINHLEDDTLIDISCDFSWSSFASAAASVREVTLRCARSFLFRMTSFCAFSCNALV